MNNFIKFEKIISDIGAKTIVNEPMSKHTTFKIGGNADIFVEIDDTKKLSDVVKILNKNKVPTFFIGNGSNILVSDDGFRGVIIKLSGEFKSIKLVKNNIIRCGAGVLLSNLCKFAQQHGLTGLEFAYGIPGTVGGAVYMNSGAYGGQIADVLHSVKSLTFNGDIINRNLDQLSLGYRKSVYNQSNEVIIFVDFLLKSCDPMLIEEKMTDFLKRRTEKQPLEYPSAGSIFKRPAGNYAGTLIQNCGLKGKKIGGAMVSDKHAGFIVNVGNATCKDVVELIKYIQLAVFNKTGINLECEIKQI